MKSSTKVNRAGPYRIKRKMVVSGVLTRYGHSLLLHNAELAFEVTPSPLPPAAMIERMDRGNDGDHHVA